MRQVLVLGNVKNVIEKIQHVVSRRNSRLERSPSLPLLSCDRRVLKNIETSHDAMKRSPKLVAHMGKELIIVSRPVNGIHVLLIRIFNIVRE